MVRLAVLLCAVTGCARDSGTSPPDAAHAAPDGAVVGIDAPVATVCDEAMQHSDLAWIQDHVFTPSCATGSCHRGSSPAVGLSLEAGQSFGNLVGHDASTASGWVRVAPGSPTTSYLVVALGRASGPAPKDGTMPLGMPALCGPKLDAIERWITTGAPQ